jgi:hypothetical protein
MDDRRRNANTLCYVLCVILIYRYEDTSLLFQHAKRGIQAWHASVLAMRAHQAIREKNWCKKNQYKKAVPIYVV